MSYKCIKKQTTCIQFDRKVISRSASFNFIDNFSNLHSFNVDDLLYFCTMSYITFPNVLCNIKHNNTLMKVL